MIETLYAGRKEILDGMLGSNLVVFQTYSYSRHFTSSCIRVCGYEVTSGGGIDVQGHVSAIGYCPVGVDAERVAKDTCVHSSRSAAPCVPSRCVS